MSMTLTAVILIELCFDGRRVWPCALCCVCRELRAAGAVENRNDIFYHKI